MIEDGKWQAVDEGAPQGASVSPLIADVYLHYVLDGGPGAGGASRRTET